MKSIFPMLPDWLPSGCFGQQFGYIKLRVVKMVESCKIRREYLSCCLFLKAPSGVKGMALILENENVIIVIFSNDISIKEGNIVKRTKSIMDVPIRKALLSCVVDVLGVPIDGKGALSVVKRRRVEVKPPRLLHINLCMNPFYTNK